MANETVRRLGAVPYALKFEPLLLWFPHVKTNVIRCSKLRPTSGFRSSSHFRFLISFPHSSSSIIVVYYGGQNGQCIEKYVGEPS